MCVKEEEWRHPDAYVIILFKQSHADVQESLKKSWEIYQHSSVHGVPTCPLAALGLNSVQLLRLTGFCLCQLNVFTLSLSLSHTRTHMLLHTQTLTDAHLCTVMC